MLIQRDSFISFEPSRIVTFKRWAKYKPDELTEQQMLKLVSEGIAGNEDLAGERIKREKDKRDENLIRSNLYNGWLNPAAARNMRTILMNWTQAIEMHSDKQAVNAERIFPILLTLTWPGTQFVSDYDAKICLEKFLSGLNRFEDTRYEREKRSIQFQYPGKENRLMREITLKEAADRHAKALRKYLWRAEPQENGNIHFHLLLDGWIDKDSCRQFWNKKVEEYTGAVSMYQYSQQQFYRITHKVRNDPETVYGTSKEDWNPRKPFVYNGYRFRLDQDAQKMKISSIRNRISKAVSTQKMPFLMEEGEVLRELFQEAIYTRKLPSTNALTKAAEQLQLNAFCKAVDNEFMDPPTTRIESMRNVRSLAAYLAKYMAKPTVKQVTEKVDLEKEADREGYEWIGDKLFDDQENEVLPEKTSIITQGRRLHGRIWGKSRALNMVRDFGFFKLSESSYTSFHGMVETGHEVKEKKIQKRVPNPDLFGVVHYDIQTEVDRKIVPVIDYKKATGSRITQAALPYYEVVRDFLGEGSYWQDTEEGKDPNVTIVKLSQQLPNTSGEKPTYVGYTQTQLMQRFCHELRDAYHAHYHDLFYTLYNSPKHLEHGEEPPTDAVATNHRLRFMPRIELSIVAA